jgi:hypothetical protein
VGLEQPAPCPGAAPAGLLPVSCRLGEIELRHHALADAVEDVLLVLDVVVERHRLDPELAPDPTHGDGVQALRVHESKRGLDHAFPRERLAVASLGRGVDLSCGPGHSFLSRSSGHGNVLATAGLTAYIVRLYSDTP